MQEGDQIPPGNWGRVVLGWGFRHAFFYREYLWEKIRQLEFPQLPSRMKSAFAFEDQRVADNFLQIDNQETFTYWVHADPGSTATRADMRWLDGALLDRLHRFDDLEAVVRNYWAGKPMAGPVQWEWLFEGPLTVVTRQTQIQMVDEQGLLSG